MIVRSISYRYQATDLTLRISFLLQLPADGKLQDSDAVDDLPRRLRAILHVDFARERDGDGARSNGKLASSGALPRAFRPTATIMVFFDLESSDLVSELGCRLKPL